VKERASASACNLCHYHHRHEGRTRRKDHTEHVHGILPGSCHRRNEMDRFLSHDPRFRNPHRYDGEDFDCDSWSVFWNESASETLSVTGCETLI